MNALLRIITRLEEERWNGTITMENEILLLNLIEKVQEMYN